MTEKNIILLAEDDDFDSELTIEALKEHSVANDIVRVCDGEEVIDYLKCSGKYANKVSKGPVVIFSCYAPL